MTPRTTLEKVKRPTDIVERLRMQQWPTDICREAADEIERLRDAVEAERRGRPGRGGRSRPPRARSGPQC